MIPISLPRRPALRALGLSALLLTGLSQTACLFDDRPAPPTKEERVAMHYENALRYYEMNDLERALDQANRGLQADNKDRKLRLLTGWILLRRKTRESVASAETIFRDLLGEEDYRVQLGLATALERKGVFFDEAARAIESGDRSTDGNPEQRVATYSKEAAAAWNEAIGYYGEVLQLQQGDRDALNGLMRTWALLGDDAQSLEYSDQLIASVGQHSDFWEGQLAEDITASRESQIREWLQGDDQLLLKTHLHRASVMRRIDRHSEAVDELTAAIEIDPDIPEVHSRLAQELFDLGRYRDARAAIDRYLGLSTDPFDHPNYQRAWELRNQCDTKMSEARSVSRP